MSQKIISPDGSWWCARHITFLPVSQFSKGQLRRRGSLCIDCMRTRRWRPNERFQSTRSQARERGITFDLTVAEFSRLVSQPCVYGDGTRVGLDRINNERGYISGNCVPCCYKHNLIKGKWFSFDDMLKIVALFPAAQKCGDRPCQL